MVNKISCGLVLWLVACVAGAEEFEQHRLSNWHQWRGPEATGMAPLGDPPTTWDEKTNVQWKVEIPGRGSASPIVWGDRIFVLTAIKTDRQAEAAEKSAATGSPPAVRLVAFAEPPAGEQPGEKSPATTNSESTPPAAQPDNLSGEGQRRREGGGRGRGPGGGFGRGGGRGFGAQPPTNYHQFVVLCLDRHTGKTLWQQVACEVVPHEGHHETGSFASASPITNGERVYAFFGSRGLYCYDMDGNPQWHKDFGHMQIRMSFGEGATPALYGDTLVVNWDHEGKSYIVALNARTGDEIWRDDREEQTTWSTPLIVAGAGRTQVITNGTNRIRSYDLKTGELIWECGGLGSNPIPCPVALGNVVISMTGHRDPALFAIPLDSTGDITGTDKIVWQTNQGTPYVASPLLSDGLLYFTKSRNAIFSCVDAKTGEFLIDQKRLPGMDSIYASPVGAAGRIYVSSREGLTLVLKEGPKFEVLASNQLDEPIDASPAIVGKNLYVRGESHLYCIAEQ